jgi:two-component system phosphate regulon sensor histidine kinase PhoR
MKRQIMTSIWKNSLTAVAAAVVIVSAYFIAGILILAGAQYNDINISNLKEAVKIYTNITPAQVFSEKGEASAWALRLGIAVEKPGFPTSGSVGSLYRLTLISRSGVVIFDTVADSTSMENHLNRPEFQEAFAKGIGTARRKSATIGQEYIYAAVSVFDSDSEFAGVVRLSILVPGFFSGLFSSTIPFFLGGFTIILAACAGLYYCSRRFSYLTEANLDAELEKKTTELKARTLEAEAEGRRLETIRDSMSEGVVAVDINLRTILVNPRFRSLFNIDKAKEGNGIPLLEFSNSAELERAAMQVFSSGEPFELSLKRYISGIEQHFRVFAAPLKANKPNRVKDNVQEEIQGAVIVLGDICRLVKLEQVRKDFAANVSHELRTPIQVIKGFAENILSSSFENRDDIRHFAEIIAKNTQTMENLTSDLMTLVSLEDESEPRPLKDKCTMALLITEAASMVEIAARKKNISVETACVTELSARLYGSLIIQALVNLLDNSIKYSKPNSRIHVNAFCKGEELCIEVKDEGIGIPAEHIGRLFERFYRVDSSRSREEGGTGLGLSIVRHIALLHGGKVEAESHAGEGSVFRLRIPC